MIIYNCGIKLQSSSSLLNTLPLPSTSLTRDLDLPSSSFTHLPNLVRSTSLTNQVVSNVLLSPGAFMEEDEPAVAEHQKQQRHQRQKQHRPSSQEIADRYHDHHREHAYHFEPRSEYSRRPSPGNGHCHTGGDCRCGYGSGGGGGGDGGGVGVGNGDDGGFRFGRPLFQGRNDPLRTLDAQLEIDVVCVSSSEEEDDKGVASNKNSVLDPTPKSQSPFKRARRAEEPPSSLSNHSPIRIGFDPEFSTRKGARSKVW